MDDRKPKTEQRNPRSMDLGNLDAAGVVQLMSREEHDALLAVVAATDALAVAAMRVADIYRSGSRVFMLGAGTGGRLAAMEAAEIPPTFGIEPDRFVPLIASGSLGGSAAVTASEDDAEAAAA